VKFPGTPCKEKGKNAKHAAARLFSPEDPAYFPGNVRRTSFPGEVAINVPSDEDKAKSHGFVIVVPPEPERFLIAQGLKEIIFRPTRRDRESVPDKKTPIRTLHNFIVFSL
jgi:hypothetical protein